MAYFYVSFLIGILTVVFERHFVWPWNFIWPLGVGGLYTSINMDTEPGKQLFIYPNRKFYVVVWLLILFPSVDKSSEKISVYGRPTVFSSINLTKIILILVFLTFIIQGWMCTNMVGISNQACVNDADLFRILEEFHCYFLWHADYVWWFLVIYL